MSDYLELDRDRLLFQPVDGPQPSRKIDPAALLAFVGEGGQVTARTVAARFDATKMTARTTLETTDGIDWFDGPNRTRYYTLAGGK